MFNSFYAETVDSKARYKILKGTTKLKLVNHVLKKCLKTITISFSHATITNKLSSIRNTLTCFLGTTCCLPFAVLMNRMLISCSCIYALLLMFELGLKSAKVVLLSWAVNENFKWIIFLRLFLLLGKFVEKSVQTRSSERLHCSQVHTKRISQPWVNFFNIIHIRENLYLLFIIFFAKYPFKNLVRAFWRKKCTKAIFAIKTALNIKLHSYLSFEALVVQNLLWIWRWENFMDTQNYFFRQRSYFYCNWNSSWLFPVSPPYVCWNLFSHDSNSLRFATLESMRCLMMFLKQKGNFSS